VINLHTAAFHHFLELAITDRVRHVPPDTSQDDILVKMAAFELDCHLPVPRSPPPTSIHQAVSGPKPLKPEHLTDAQLHTTMVLLDRIVQILRLPSSPQSLDSPGPPYQYLDDACLL
jgi:hypothetical protein